MPSSPADRTASPGMPDDALTPRQAEILALLRQGKVNKEIARELGISLGTVKQHVHLLLRKLQVRNRTMAAQALSPAPEPAAKTGWSTAPTSLIGAYRPCLILSIQLSTADARLERPLHGLLAEKAFDAHALLIHRQDSVYSLIFGLKRARESDLLVVLALLGQLHAHFAHAGGIKAVLLADLVRVGQNRMGGWSGEIQAALLLDRACAWLGSTKAGTLHFNEAASFLMQGMDLPVQALCDSFVLPLVNLPDFYRFTARKSPPLAGREALMARIVEQMRVIATSAKPQCDELNGVFPLILVGENGMGKTRLCEALIEQLAVSSNQLVYFLVLSGGRVLDLVQGTLLPEELSWDPEKSSGPTGMPAWPALIVMDEAHEWTQAQWEAQFARLIAARAQKASEGGFEYPPPCGLVIATRGGIHAQRYPPDWPRFEVGKLDESAATTVLECLATEATRLQPLKAWVSLARHIPFFLCELARHHGLSIAFLTLVASRLDRFRMDWQIVYALALVPKPLSVSDLAQEIGESVQTVLPLLKAVMDSGIIAVIDSAGSDAHAGVPALGPHVCVGYRHPLVKMAVSALYHGRSQIALTGTPAPFS
jgi:DNA-binding CsgD family transcriptional regulator